MSQNKVDKIAAIIHRHVCGSFVSDSTGSWAICNKAATEVIKALEVKPIKVPKERTRKGNSERKRKVKCELCGSKDDSVELDVDPFNHDVKGDDTKIFICAQCSKNQADEI